ncbi:MAG: hypothetical protein J7621_14950 [Niastella sp.]|nr:hypothetical protein [Niastella sp.]
MLDIQKKVYVIARLTNPNAFFYLTDDLYLGGIPVNIGMSPRTIDKAGKPRLDLYTFVLKSKSDKGKLQVNDILELWNDQVEVIESYQLSNGHMVAFLKCYVGKLDGPLELTDDANKKWILKRYAIVTGSFETHEKTIRQEKENIFQYLIEPQGHDTKPTEGSKLSIYKVNN